MSDNRQPGNQQDPADAELADAMSSIEAIGEDWRSSERGTDSEAPDTEAPDSEAPDTEAQDTDESDEGHDNG